MNIIEQIDYINQKVRSSYCQHTGTLTPLDLENTKLKGFTSPVTCDDCGKVIECDHSGDIENHGYSSYCVDCGSDITDYDMDYKKEF